MSAKVSPFQAPAGTPIVGQPVSIKSIEGIRISGVISCNCRPGNPDIPVENGQASGDSCGKQFIWIVNTAALPIELRVVLPTKPEVPS